EASVLKMQTESMQQANTINQLQVKQLPNIQHELTQQVYSLPGVGVADVAAATPGTREPGVRVPRASVIGTLRAMSTPRLRQDFPETMLWEPALVTDSAGRAHLNFKLADNITTWKLTAIASTKNGELGTAESDLRAFQPFFVEHDPPRILTQGDEI